MGWGKPNRRGYRVKSSLLHLSCWDCENLRVAEMPNRMCRIHWGRHIWSGDGENEAMENGGVTVADGCVEFEQAMEIEHLVPVKEKRV